MPSCLSVVRDPEAKESADMSTPLAPGRYSTPRLSLSRSLFVFLSLSLTLVSLTHTGALVPVGGARPRGEGVSGHVRVAAHRRRRGQRHGHTPPGNNIDAFGQQRESFGQHRDVLGTRWTFLVSIGSLSVSIRTFSVSGHVLVAAHRGRRRERHGLLLSFNTLEPRLE